MLLKILKSLFPKTMQDFVNYENFKAVEKANKDRWNEKINLEIMELERYQKLGPVLILCNEWSNPVVGKITQIERTTRFNAVEYQVYDYITGTTLGDIGLPWMFTMQKLKAVADLTPDGLIALYYEGRYSAKEIYKNREASFGEEGYTSYDDWLLRMEKNGFFEEFPEFKNSRHFIN